MWNIIAPYVYDQLISAVVTLLIIDRLLAWREKKKWLAVRELFLVHADRAVSQNNGVWSNWLEQVMKEAPEIKLSDEFKRSLQQRFKIPQASKGALDSVKDELQGMSEPRMGFPFKLKVIEDWRIHLTVYLAEKQFLEGHPSWEQLRNDLSGSVQKLMELVDKFSALGLNLKPLYLSFDCHLNSISFPHANKK